MLWSHLYFQGKIAEKWSIDADGSLRFRNPAEYLNSVLVRSGIHHMPYKRVEIAVGYTFTASYPSPKSNQKMVTEHRAWEQFSYKIEGGQWEGLLRLRPEQQWFDDNYQTFRLRVRTLCGASYEWHKTSHWCWKAEIYDEVFPALDNRRNFAFTDQNRVYAGIQTEFKEKIGISVGYQYGYFPGREGKSANVLHQLRIHLKYKVDWATKQADNKQ